MHVLARPTFAACVLLIIAIALDPDFRLGAFLDESIRLSSRLSHYIQIPTLTLPQRAGVGKRWSDWAANRLTLTAFAAIGAAQMISVPERAARHRGSLGRGETVLLPVAPLPLPQRSFDPMSW